MKKIEERGELAMSGLDRDVVAPVHSHTASGADRALRLSILALEPRDEFGDRLHRS